MRSDSYGYRRRVCVKEKGLNQKREVLGSEVVLGSMSL